MRKCLAYVFVAAMSLFALAACVSTSGGAYAPVSVSQTQTLIHGTVTSAVDVVPGSALNSAGVATAGVAAGNALGAGDKDKAAAIGQGVAGEVAGQYVQDVVCQGQCYRVTFAADDGRDLAFTIKKSDLGVAVGARGCLDPSLQTRVIPCADRPAPATTVSAPVASASQPEPAGSAPAVK